MRPRRLANAFALVIGLALVGLPCVVRAADSDGDGVDDAVDVCSNTPDGTAVDAEGRPLGDIDGDCDTDLNDYALFQQGFTGPLSCTPESDCADGLDNDDDGLPDCLDPDCDGRLCGAYGEECIGFECQCLETDELCTDGVDNDCDGLSDCEDPDCDGLSCGQFGVMCIELTCQCPESIEVCDDNVDNDCNGMVDCEEPGCDGQQCSGFGQVCIGQVCVCPGDVEVCDDQIDNDCDGLVDCEDVADCPPGTACGAANLACTPSGDCACTPPNDDCDDIPENGCETNLDSDVNHCGICGNACNLPHATEERVDGTCQIAMCDLGWLDADGNPENGCEFSLGETLGYLQGKTQGDALAGSG